MPTQAKRAYCNVCKKEMEEAYFDHWTSTEHLLNLNKKERGKIINKAIQKKAIEGVKK